MVIFTMTITKDPIYRYYNSNIQCPNLKTETLTVNYLNPGSLSNDLLVSHGIFLFGTSFTFNSSVLSALSQRNLSGELTLYIKNDALDVANVTTIILIKTANVLTNADFYQRVGNLTSLTTAIVSNNLVVSISPGATCRWVFRGI